MRDEYIIKSEEDLRAVLPSPTSRVEKKIIRELDEQCSEFIRTSPICFVSTSDKNNKQDVSPKGDSPGFVKIHDAKTLLLPERPGNRLAFGFRNIIETGRIGLIFIIPGVLETLRINGTAQLTKDPEVLEALSAKGKPALLCSVITIEECFMHCGKAMVRSELWKPDSWTTDHGFSCAAQLADTFKADKEEIQKSLDDAYKNRLY